MRSRAARDEQTVTISTALALFGAVLVLGLALQTTLAWLLGSSRVDDMPFLVTVLVGAVLSVRYVRRRPSP